MGGRGQRRDKTTKFMQALLGVTLAAHANPPPAVPEEAKRAKELYSSFINKGKRAKAWKELEALLKAKPCSALCITAAKMHMIAAVEQVCKAEEDGAREAAALQSMHNVLDFAVQGALEYGSIQCVVLAVFTLHTCRGRGSPEQLRWRRERAAALEARVGGPAASAARWAKTKWVDPRLESYEKDRFPFEWEPYSSKNLKEWIEAVRDDWNKFLPTIQRADQLAEERSAAGGPAAAAASASGSSGELAGGPVEAAGLAAAGADAAEVLQEEIGTPVDVRLAGSFALKHCDKDAIRRHLDALEAKRKPAGSSSTAALAAPPPPPKPAPTPASTRAGRAATAAAAAAVVQLAAAAGKEERGGGPGGMGAGPPPLPAPAAAPYSRSGLSDSSLLLPHQQGGAAGKGRERHRAEQKRQQAQRAQQRAADIQAYLASKLEEAGEDAEEAQRLLAESCCMGAEEFAAAVKAAVAAKELTQVEADLAMANLERLRGTDSCGPRHVWYGDPHLDINDRRHEVEGQEEMEDLLTEHLQQDWMAAEEATDWVGSHLDGWRELLSRMGLEANTMTDVDRDSMLAQEDPSVGQTLVRVWTEDYAVPPPSDAGAEVDEAADAELEALLPAGARPCSCGRCQREQQQASASGGPGSEAAAADAISGASGGSSGGDDACSRVHGAAAALPPPPASSRADAAVPKPADPAGQCNADGTAPPAGSPAGAAVVGGAGAGAGASAAGSSPSRVALAQQQWREAMHSEEYGSVLQLDVYINEAERSQQYLDSILARPEGLMQQCRVLAANPEGAPSNEADELVRRAVVGHLMLRLAGAWDEPRQSQQQQPAAAAGPAGEGDAATAPAAPRPEPAAGGSGVLRGSITHTLHLLRRAMDPSCDLESLIMDCAVDEVAGRSAVQKLGQLREAELAAEAAASKAWAELAAAMQSNDGSGERKTGPDVAALSSMALAASGVCAPPAAAAEAAAGMDAREDDGAISRPVTFCTPLLTTVLEGVSGTVGGGSGGSSRAGNGNGSSSRRGHRHGEASGSSSNSNGISGEPCASSCCSWQQERERLVAVKGQLARSALLGLGQIWRRRRLTDKMSFQLCQFIADSLATCGELSPRPAEREVLRRAAERLLVGPAPAPCVLRLAGWLPLRVLRHLYTFVVLLVGECFASPQDLSEEIEDLVYADASAGALSEDGTAISVRPAVFAALTPVQTAPGGQGSFMDALGPEALGGKKKAGRADPFAPGGELGSLSDALRSSDGGEGEGSGNWLARVAAYVCAPSEAQQAQQAQQEGGREEVVGDLHKLWHVEGVLLGLANLCEYWERGLDDSLARMEALRATLEQLVAGAKEFPDTPENGAAKGSFLLEQQLLEARKVLQATEAVELSLRLAVIKMHGVCFEDVLGMLRERSADLDIKDDACTAAAISKFECMLRDSSAEGEACRGRMQELAAAPPPALEGKEAETVRALGLVLGAGQNGRAAPPAAKIRALLAARPERWEANLAAGRELVLGTLRRLDECTEALATLGEWCYIKQCSLIGQLRSQYCTHSCGDEIVGVLLRLLAVQRWEPAILAEQERERSALAQALETELEAEREREAQSKAAKAAKARQKAALQAGQDVQEGAMQQQQDGENGVPSIAAHTPSSSGSDSSSEDEEEPTEHMTPSGRQPDAGAPAAGINSEGDWVADLLARQQPRPVAVAPSAAAAAHAAAKGEATSAKVAKQQAAAAGKKAAAPPPPREVMRVVSYAGDWLCGCGQLNKLRDPCPVCGQKEPCRDWVRGICDFPQCRFPHPPFDLPATTHIKKSARIANPAPDAPIYGKAPTAAAAAGGSAAAAKQAVQKRASSGALAAAAGAAPAAAAHLKAGSRPLASTGSNSSSGSLHADGVAPSVWGLPPAAQSSDGYAAVAPGSKPASFAAAVTGLAVPPAAAREAAADRSQSWPARPTPAPPVAQQPAQPLPSSNGGSAANSGRASPAPGGAPSAAGGISATSAPVAGPCQPVSPGLSFAAAAAGTRPAPHATAAGGSAAAAAAAVTAAPSLLPPMGGMQMAQPPQPAAWGSQGLGQPQPTQAPQEEAECPVEDAEDDEAYFSCFNTQLLQGLGLGGPDDFGPLPPVPEPPHRTPTPPSIPSGALGEHNSFLSAIVLCLWHCPEFREEMRSWPEPVYVAHPVVKALYSLFHSLAEARSSRAGGGSGGGGLAPLSSLNASELREALGALPGQLLSPGEPASAGAVLLAMFERIQEVAAMRGKPMLADIVFGLPVEEAVQCRSCQRLSQQAAYMQYFLSVQASALLEQRRALGGEACSLGRMLRLIADQSQKPCDKGAGGCGALNSVSRALQSAPRVFTLQLGWGKPSDEAARDIGATLREVQEQLDLADLYPQLVPGRFLYRLRSMVCTRPDAGAAPDHAAFVLAPAERSGGNGQWMLVESGAVSRVGSAGSWAGVQARCEAAPGLQPTMLFFVTDP